MTAHSIAPYTPNVQIVEVASQSITFQHVVELAEKTVASSSARVYRAAWQSWSDWCSEHAHDSIDLAPGAIVEWLAAGNTTRATRQNRLSALRALAGILALLNGERAKVQYELLKKLRAPDPAEGQGRERARAALSPAEVDKVLRVWSDDTLPDVRNRAIVSTLAFTGMRRAELAALRWSDIDLERGIIHIAHGKGDKSRDVAIVGDFAVAALSSWRKITEGRNFAFCGLLKGRKLAADRPMSTRAVNDVIDQTGALADVKLTPHMFRRAWVTEWLDTGGSLAEAQAQAGHANEATTLRYARPSEAKIRRSKARFRFG